MFRFVALMVVFLSSLISFSALSLAQGSRVGQIFEEAVTAGKKSADELGSASRPARELADHVAKQMPAQSSAVARSDDLFSSIQKQRELAEAADKKMADEIASMRAVSADATVLQTGGNKLQNRTAASLNEHFDVDLHKGEWGNALEDLKKRESLSANYHAKIWSDGSYTSKKGDIYHGNLGDYIK